MPLSDFVNSEITLTSVALEAATVDVGMLLTYDVPAAFVERTRTYTSAAGLTTDLFPATHPAYLAAARFFSQSPKPKTLVVGRGALPPTQRIKLTPNATNSAVYKVKINGVEVSFTADSSATVAEICTGLAAAISALAVANLTVTDQTTRIDLVMAAGKFVSVEALDTSLITVIQDHADPGVATDLAAIKLENPNWFGLLTTFNSKAYVDAAAAWAETNRKYYVAQSQDSTIENSAISGTDDVMEAAKAASQYFFKGLYHRQTSAFADAAYMGVHLASTPGEITMEMKTLIGVPTLTFTTTQQTNITARNCGYYYSVASVGCVNGSMVASGEWSDSVRDREYMNAKIQEDQFVLIKAAKKIGMSDPGIAKLEAQLLATLDSFVKMGILSVTPAPVVTAPKVSTISSAERAARRLTGANAIKWDAKQEGAIHLVDFKGTVSP